MESLKILFLYLLNYTSQTLLPLHVTTIPDITFNDISSIRAGLSGNLIVTDNHAIWNVDITVNPPTKYLIAGGINDGYNEGRGGDARFRYPADSLLISHNDFLVSDAGNECIRIVDLLTNTTSRYAGICENQGSTDGHRLNATFNRPRGIFKLASKVYIADGRSHSIRVLEFDNVATLFSRHPLMYPTYLTACSEEALFVSIDSVVVRIDLRTVSPGLVIGSYQGLDDGSVGESRFIYPLSLTHLNEHTVVFTDNHNFRLRIADLQNDKIRSICVGDRSITDGNISHCSFANPKGVHIYGDQLVVGDISKIRRIPLYSLIDKESDNGKCVNREHPVPAQTANTTEKSIVNYLLVTSFVLFFS